MANYDSTHTGATIDSAVSQVTDSTTDFNVDSNTLVVDKSANSVGIGIAAPASALHIAGTMQVGADGSGQDVIFYSDTSGDNLTWDASEEKLTITGTDAQTALDIADGNLVVADDVDIEGDIDVNGTANLDNTDIDGTFTQDAGAVVFNEAGADYDFRVEGVGAANALFVQGSDGFVGIGTAAPAAILHIEDAVDGDMPIRLLNTGGGAGSTNESVSIEFWLQNGTGGSSGVSSIKVGKDSDHATSAAVDDFMSFSTVLNDSAAERMRIDSSGNVGIGTASPASNCHIEDTGAAELIIASSGMGGATLKLIDSNASGDTDSNAVEILGIAPTGNEADMRFRAANSSGTMTERMRIDGGTGNVGIGTAAPGSELDLGGGYMANEQGRQDHVANTMPAPYYRFDGSDDVISINALATELVDTTNTTGTVVWCGKFNDFTTDYSRIWQFGDTSANEFIALYVSSTNYTFGAHCKVSGTDKWQFETDNTFSEDIEYTVVMVHDGTAPVLYVNGVLEPITFSVSTDKTVWLAGVTGVDNCKIGCMNSNGAGDAYFLEAEANSFKAYNLALSAAEVKELSSGASVPFKYKGANQTDIHTSSNAITYSSETDSTSGWTDHEDSGTASVLTSESGAGDHNSTYGFKFVTSGDTVNGRAHYSPSGITIGKRYRVTLDVKYVSGSANWYFGAGSSTYASNQKFFEGSTITDATSWTTLTTEFTATGEWSKIAMVRSGTGSGEIYFDNFNLVPIGAVAEYDGSGASDTVWYDKSGNDLDGTVTGATLENKLDTIQTSGITFPATAHASSNANTLDDYEEGTWTAGFTIGGSTTGITYNRQYGFYTKIGRLVYVNGYVSLTNKGVQSGAVVMTGLPFACNSSTGSSVSGSMVIAQTNFANDTDIGFLLTESGTTIALSDTATGAATTAMDESNLENNTAIQFSMTYIT